MMIHTICTLEHLMRTTQMDGFKACIFLDTCNFHWRCDWEFFKRVIAPSITDDDITMYTRKLHTLSVHEISAAWDVCVYAYRPPHATQDPND